jgi:predicted nucleotidyltransferase
LAPACRSGRLRARTACAAARSDPGAPLSDLDAIDAVLYGDVFDCAVTLEEAWRYARVAVGRDELARRLHDDPLVAGGDGLYCLAGREELLPCRPERIRNAARLERRARRVARVLRHFPFVRGLALTGSAAAGDAGTDDDVDLLVTVAEGRLGTAFVLLGSLSRLLGRRLFCPNYYVCEDRLGLGPANLYLARELAQARPLAGDGAALWRANSWLAETFPNAEPPAGAGPNGSRLQGVVEALVDGRVERWARRVARRRLRAHYCAVPADVEDAFAAGVALRFHGSGVAARTLERHRARRVELAA